MKNKIILLSLIFSLIFCTSIIASTNVQERTEDNLQVADRIEITDYRKSIILKTPKVDESEKIYDFADLLTNSEETQLFNKANEFIQKYNMDIVVVTINTNNKGTAQKYADDFYDYNYFGKELTCDGLLFLIDMDTRKMWISTTGQAILMYDDERIDYILDDTYYYITDEEYYECANAFLDGAISYAGKGIPYSNSNSYIDENGKYISIAPTPRFPIVGIIIFSVIVTTIAILIMVSMHRTVRKGSNAKQYLKNFELTRKEDNFVNTYTSKVYDPPSTSSGGGGGGGSSSHSGSSGISHGGGGRSF